MFSLWLSCYRTGVSTQTEMCFWAVRQAAESGRRRQLLSLRRYRWCLYAGTWMVHGRWEELSASTFSFSALNHHTDCVAVNCWDCVIVVPLLSRAGGTVLARLCALRELTSFFFFWHTYIQTVLCREKDQRCFVGCFNFYYKPPWNVDLLSVGNAVVLWCTLRSGINVAP